MVDLTKLLLSLSCTIVGVCGTSTAVTAEIKRGKEVYNTYLQYGGCYQTAMNSLRDGCEGVLSDQHKRDKCKFSCPLCLADAK
jgi:hypothetical protein